MTPDRARTPRAEPGDAHADAPPCGAGAPDSVETATPVDRRRHVVMAGVLLAIAALTAVNVVGTLADGPPRGTPLCVAATPHPQAVLTPGSAGCPSGYATALVANDTDVSALAQRLGGDEAALSALSAVSGVHTSQIADLQARENADSAGVAALQQSGTARYASPGPATYLVPAGAHELDIDVWGGGGGGAGSATSCLGTVCGNATGGGGAQGDYAHGVITVTPGDHCALTVGAGGMGGGAAQTTDGSRAVTGDAGSGADSTIACEAGTLDVSGGGGGAGAAAVPAGGAAGAGGVAPAPGSAPSAGWQTYRGSPGAGGTTTPCIGVGGGMGFPGGGGSGGGCNSDGATGSPGLVLITPLG